MPPPCRRPSTPPPGRTTRPSCAMPPGAGQVSGVQPGQLPAGYESLPSKPDQPDPGGRHGHRKRDHGHPCAGDHHHLDQLHHRDNSNPGTYGSNTAPAPGTVRCRRRPGPVRLATARATSPSAPVSSVPSGPCSSPIGFMRWILPLLLLVGLCAAAVRTWPTWAASGPCRRVRRHRRDGGRRGPGPRGRCAVSGISAIRSASVRTAMTAVTVPVAAGSLCLVFAPYASASAVVGYRHSGRAGSHRVRRRCRSGGSSTPFTVALPPRPPARGTPPMTGTTSTATWCPREPTCRR